MKKSTARADSYVRSPDFADHIAGVCFPPEVWAVFAQCDAPRSPAEIARRTRLDETAVGAALRRLARRRLVQKNQLDWKAYLTTQGDPAAEMAPPPVPMTAPLPAAQAAAPLPAVAPPPAPPVPVAVAPTPTPLQPPAAVAAAPAPTVAPAPVPPTAPAAAAMSREAPIEFVIANTSAAVARCAAARNMLTVSVGKSVACPAKPLLAA